jgi:hypothetical protein
MTWQRCEQPFDCLNTRVSPRASPICIEHFQGVARGHFTVRRLERVYGKDVVRTEYERLAQQR